MARRITSFRVGKVRAYLRSNVWYLCYYEEGQRRRPRVGPDRVAARQLAAQTNSQLELNAPAPLSFAPISIAELRRLWLHYHEHVLRSSLATVRRYRAASAHLLRFTEDVRPTARASDFGATHAEAFAAYLRRVEVAPNGHPHTRKRRLRDKGVKYILEVCRSLFTYALRRRHLPPYAQNPFATIGIERLAVEDARPFVDFDREQERRFLEACDAWQFPLFVTLLLTGLRPGELTHLLLPGDLDLDRGWLHVRNKAGLGWKVKTRSGRSVPLLPELVGVLRGLIDARTTGPVFLRRRVLERPLPPLAALRYERLQDELQRRMAQQTVQDGCSPREAEQRVADRFWRELGMVSTDRIRIEFMRVTTAIGLPQVTAPKTLRHLFATALQDANVDPLIRNELMGHAPPGVGTPHGGLAMTGVYTHSRPETIRRQVTRALRGRPAVEVSRRWLAACAAGTLRPSVNRDGPGPAT